MRHLLWPLVLFATSLSAGERVLINPEQDGNLLIKVNDGGTVKTMSTYDATNARIGIGPTATSPSTMLHVIDAGTDAVGSTVVKSGASGAQNTTSLSVSNTSLGTNWSDFLGGITNERGNQGVLGTSSGTGGGSVLGFIGVRGVGSGTSTSSSSASIGIAGVANTTGTQGNYGVAATAANGTGIGVGGYFQTTSSVAGSAGLITSNQTSTGNIFVARDNNTDVFKIADGGIVSQSTFSTVTVDTGNGYGSTNTFIPRFTSTRVNTGTGITYADSAANGASFTINETGIYSITIQMAIAQIFGITKNADGTSAFASATAANKLCNTENTHAGISKGISCTVKLDAGDVVRAHVQVADSNTDSENRVKFIITKVLGLH